MFEAMKSIFSRKWEELHQWQLERGKQIQLIRFQVKYQVQQYLSIVNDRLSDGIKQNRIGANNIE